MEEKEEVINIADLVQIVYANWKWYILSVIVCLGLAILSPTGGGFTMVPSFSGPERTEYSIFSRNTA